MSDWDDYFDPSACVVCGRKDHLDPHHVFPKQKWPELKWEPDNIIPVCRKCHADHEVAYRRLPRAAVKPAERLATDDRMKAYLDRTYA